jgi:hypothetical protein
MTSNGQKNTMNIASGQQKDKISNTVENQENSISKMLKYIQD